MSKKKKFAAPFADKGNFQGEKFGAPVIDALERKVRFSLKNCEISNNYCISNFSSNKELLKDVYKQLGFFEGMTWQQVKTRPRESGISIEKRDSLNYKNLSATHTDFDTFGHLRVSSARKPTFRVFGAIREDLFYILRFDVEGSINH